MFSDRCYDRDDINNNFTAKNMDIDMNIEVDNNMNQSYIGNNMSQPIIEPMQERIVNRDIIHEVNHICPIRTRIINHHIFKHNYQPSYSCCEENVCSEMTCDNKCNF